MKHFLYLFFLSFLLVGCTGGGTRQQDKETPDSSSVVPEQRSATVVLDTLRGFVGDGTSMNMIELVNTEATDTAYLELGDDVQRRATLEVGNEVKVIVRQEADGTQTVLATENAN